jgi:hypothetical protein
MTAQRQHVTAHGSLYSLRLSHITLSAKYRCKFVNGLKYPLSCYGDPASGTPVFRLHAKPEFSPLDVNMARTPAPFD